MSYNLVLLGPLLLAGAVQLLQGKSCPDSMDVPEGSLYPFAFGLGTSAYQIEGAVNEGGRGDSVWDVFVRQPGKIKNNATGDVADDFVHRFQDDVALMKAAGVRNFRFSVSWPRVMPTGTGEVSEQGLAFYSQLVDALLEACINPIVTLYHWDTPQVLQDAYGGWTGGRIVGDFAEYAAVMFTALGDRVKTWTTLNEPWTFCNLGYGFGAHAPGIVSKTEPYWCAYHTSLAHAAAVARFREIVPAGKIGLATPMNSYSPLDPNSPADVEAVERARAWQTGLFIDPIYKGDLPAVVREELPWLPQYTPEQKAALMASKPDYFGFNYYTSKLVGDDPTAPPLYTKETNQTLDGKDIGPRTDAEWLSVTPWGLRDLLNWLKATYGDEDYWLLENGMPVIGEGSMTAEQAYNDQARIDYYKAHMDAAKQAVEEDGVKLKLATFWSLLDNFEWAEGYTQRFGIVFVDYATQQRTPKASFKWAVQSMGLGAPGAVATHGQCGGKSTRQEAAECADAPWAGAFCADIGSYCCRINEYYWQCKPVSGAVGFDGATAAAGSGDGGAMTC